MKPLNPLQLGDTIAITCPASRELSEDVVKRAQAHLQQLGYQVIYDKTCYEYCPPEEKANIFLNYVFDDAVRMIWPLRGGEGSADLLPFLEKHRDRLQSLAPKWLMCLSDITVLLNYFAFQFDWPVVHGMGSRHFCDNPADDKTQALTLAMLKGEIQPGIDQLTPLNALAKQTETITAVCAGGTLSLLNIAIGDVWQFSAAGKIILVEDMKEPVHKIHRSLKYLQRIDFFKGAKAILFGDFNARPIGQTAQEHDKNASDILRYLGYFAETCPFPVFHTHQYGHGKTNYPIFLNVPMQLSSKMLTLHDNSRDKLFNISYTDSIG